MKNYCFILGAAFTFCLISCKRNLLDNSGKIQIHHSIHYNVIATIPSPADSARGILKDSIVLDTITSNAGFNKTYLDNFPFLTAFIHVNDTGFGLLYDDPDKIFPYFSICALAFHTVPRDFRLNAPYYSSRTRAIFLGMHTGMDGWNYFVDNVYPVDAGPVVSNGAAKLIFSKRDAYANCIR